MHAKSGLRVFLEWKIYRPDSVIAAVIRLDMAESTYKTLSRFIRKSALHHFTKKSNDDPRRPNFETQRRMVFALRTIL